MPPLAQNLVIYSHRLLLSQFSTSWRIFYATPFCNFECCHFVRPDPIRVVQCQSSCGELRWMALREHLREAERKGLGEESTRIGHRGAQNKIFGLDCYFSRSFRAQHTPDPAVPCDLTTARDLNRAQQPQHDIPQMAGQETVTNPCTVAGVVTESSRISFLGN